MEEYTTQQLEKMLRQKKEELKLYKTDVVVLQGVVNRLEKLIAERKQHENNIRTR